MSVFALARWGRSGRWLLAASISGSLIGMPAVALAGPHEIVQKHCAPFGPTEGAPPEHPRAARKEITALTEARDPRALSLACGGWLRALAQPQADPLDVIRWRVMVADVLGWSNQRALAEEVFLDAYGAYERAAHPDPEESGHVAAFVAVLALQQGETQIGYIWSSKALEHYDHPAARPDRRYLQQIRLNHATILSRLRRFDEAQAVFERSLAESRSEPKEADLAATALRGIAIALRRQAKSLEGLRATEEEISFRSKSLPTEYLELAVAYQNRATFQIDLGDMRSAEEALQIALETVGKGGVDLFAHTASMFETLSIFQLQRGRPIEAAASASRAVDLIGGPQGPGEGSPRMARALRRLADAQLASGKIAPALVSIRRALDISERSEKPADLDSEVAIRLTYARLQLMLGAPVEATLILDRALVRSGSLPLAVTERASLLATKAAAEAQSKNAAAAAELLKQADELLAPHKPTTDMQRLLIAADRCRFDGSQCAAIKAVVDGPQVGSDGTQAQLLLALASRSETSEALDLTQRALWAANGSGSPRLMALAYLEHAQVLARSRRFAEASFFGKKGVLVLQQQREEILAQVGTRAEAGFVAVNALAYQRLADWLAQQGRLDETVRVLALLRQQELDEFIELSTVRGTAADNVLVLTDAEQQFDRLLDQVVGERSRRAAEIARLQRMVQAQRATADERDRLALLQGEQANAERAELQRLQGALSDFERSRSAEQATLATARGGRPAASSSRESSGRGAAAAGTATLQVHLFQGESGITAVFETAQSRRLQRLGVSDTDLAPRIAEVLDQLRSRQTPMPALRSLYQDLGAPIDAAASAAGATRVQLWLHGALRYLPFGLLHDGRQFLVEKFVLTHGVSGQASASRLSGKLAERTSPRVQAFGVTRSLAGLRALPGVADETCSIVNGPLIGLDAGALPTLCKRTGDDGVPVLGTGSFRGRGDLNEHFTEPALVRFGRESARGDLLHIGTHFVLRPGNASRSWLLLGNGDRLTVERINGISLGSPGIVTLSACETAVPTGQADGREVGGLAAMLVANGARRVVATLWHVEDDDASRLMQRFYAELAKSPDDAEAALTRAQRAVLRVSGGAGRLGWGAFVVSSSGAVSPRTSSVGR